MPLYLLQNIWIILNNLISIQVKWILYHDDMVPHSPSAHMFIRWWNEFIHVSCWDNFDAWIRSFIHLKLLRIEKLEQITILAWQNFNSHGDLITLKNNPRQFSRTNYDDYSNKLLTKYSFQLIYVYVYEFNVFPYKVPTIQTDCWSIKFHKFKCAYTCAFTHTPLSLIKITHYN